MAQARQQEDQGTTNPGLVVRGPRVLGFRWVGGDLAYCFDISVEISWSV